MPNPITMIVSPGRIPDRRNDLTTHADGSTSTPSRSCDTVGQRQRIALVDGADQEKFGHPARVDFAAAPGGALHVLGAPAGRALKTGRMMMHENALSGAEPAHRRARLFDHSDRLMTQHQRRLAANIPGRDLAGADAACGCPHQDIVGSDVGRRMILDADIAKVVKTSDLHDRNFPAATILVNLRCVARGNC